MFGLSLDSCAGFEHMGGAQVTGRCRQRSAPKGMGTSSYARRCKKRAIPLVKQVESKARWGVRTDLRELTGVAVGNREDGCTLEARNKVLAIYSISPRISTVNHQYGIVSMWKFSTWNDLFSLVRCFDLITSWNAANICKTMRGRGEFLVWVL